jgi:hypothetical protein
MKYFHDPSVGVRAFEEDGSQDFLITEEMRQLTPEEVASHLNPAPTYSKALASLNAAYQIKIDGFNRQFALAALADGPSEEAKKLSIRGDYDVAKAQHAVNIAQLKTQYGIGV